MNVLLTILSVFTTAVKRLRANLGLALCALAALVAAVALAVSVPAYAEGASLRLLREEIAQVERRDGRSPFALLFRYVGAWNGPLEWERVRPADELISGVGVRSLGLPLDSFARHARTDQLRLFLPPSASGGQNQFLKNVTLGFITGLDAQMRIVDGAAPQPLHGAPTAAAPLEVLLARELADELGVNVGETFTLVGAGSRPVSLPIRVAGLWAPVSAGDPAWFFAPGTLKDVLLVPEASFTGPVAEALRNEVGQVLWFARLSGAGLTAAEAAPLLGRVEAVRAQAAGAVPGLRLEQSPAEALARYREGARQLTLQLLVFSVPILGLVLYFVALVATLLVNRQRGEIALLKTRGVRDAQILGVYVVEWGLLGAVALAAGPQLGLLFARLMGRTSSFLQLSETAEPLALALTPETLAYGLAAVLLALAAALAPALGATRRTLVDEQQQAARALRPPFWQRLYLDLLLLVPPAYGLYQLQRSGGLFFGQRGAQGADPFANPLLMLVPVLLCFALGLLAVRLFPLLLELLARLARLPNWTVPLVVLRNLARQPGAYRGPLLLLILTLSLAAFSASMAATIDGALRTAIAYQVGADMQLLETGQSTEQRQGQQPGGQPQAPERKDIEEEARFLIYPVTDHLEVPGVLAATRVGTYDATIQLGGANRSARVVGIDRSDFPKVVGRFERAWGGGESLGALMNLLARNADGALVSRDVLARGLKVGDRLPVLMRMYGDQRQVQYRIVGVIDLWPGYYPQDGPIVVANLNYIFDQMSGQYPYDVWIKRDPAARPEEIVAGVRRLGITVVDALDAATLIAREQARPSRQGLFGLLSVGFVAAGGLTLLGFLLAGLITARRRAIELGVLQALGLSGGQVALALTLEQLLLVAAGVAAGTGIGALAARLVVPLLQVGAGPYPGTPAYAPQIAWEQVAIIYTVFAAALLLTLIALGISLGRMRLFQAVKLGDAN
ncbi:MAG TPA: FtsX-like permease family protein [Roseiflexaceae bacterium]|nr:FtsX-like permease family protein [Roseiflexaceae bacterium]